MQKLVKFAEENVDKAIIRKIGESLSVEIDLQKNTDK